MPEPARDAPGAGHLIDVIQSSTVTTSACTGKTFSVRVDVI
jgi:hypothetical protein